MIWISTRISICMHVWTRNIMQCEIKFAIRLSLEWRWFHSTCPMNMYLFRKHSGNCTVWRAHHLLIVFYSGTRSWQHASFKMTIQYIHRFYWCTCTQNTTIVIYLHWQIETISKNSHSNFNFQCKRKMWN